ncbi:MAG: hypothetical protein IT204_01235 [Fimbriimonadaceae bacterium]|nr:hypothetical protein [Fimbriimonadaceae bacterium]
MAQREVEELNSWVQRVLEYAGTADFEAERQAAQEELYGQPAGDGVADLLDPRHGALGWFLFDRRLQDTDLTPVRLFVERHRELPPRLRRNLLGCEQSLWSTFRVVECHADRVVLLDLLGDESDYYQVQRRPGAALATDDLITARLIRWDDAWCLQGPAEPWPSSPRDLLRSRPQAGSERRGSAPVGAYLERDSGGAWYTSRRAWLRDRRRRP